MNILFRDSPNLLKMLARKPGRPRREQQERHTLSEKNI